MEKNRNLTKKITESALMIALATVLSMLKLIEMPYGGSVTFASMLPIVIIAYRHGIGVGLASGFTFAVIQQLLGLSNLSYVTGWQSVVAVITLDYALAFTALGFGGIFRGKLTRFINDNPKRQASELATGTLFACVLRYLCHTIAGATVWAGLSIPSGAALIYSIGYNATYMLPEAIVSAMVIAYLGARVDFSRSLPERFSALRRAASGRGSGACEIFPHISALLIIVAVAVDTVLIAPMLQDAETGAFSFAGLSEVKWWLVITLTALCALAAAALLIAKRAALRCEKKDKAE